VKVNGVQIQQPNASLSAESKSSELLARYHNVTRTPSTQDELRDSPLRAAFSPLRLAPGIPLKHLSRLLCPGQRGAVAQIENRHRRPLTSVDQSLQHLGRKTGQPQLATDVPIMASLPQR
jgi:hypothetical protein